MAKKPAVHELDHSGMPFFILDATKNVARSPVALAAQNNCVFSCKSDDDNRFVVHRWREARIREVANVAERKRRPFPRARQRASRLGCNGRLGIYSKHVVTAGYMEESRAARSPTSPAESRQITARNSSSRAPANFRSRATPRTIDDVIALIKCP